MKLVVDSDIYLCYELKKSRRGRIKLRTFSNNEPPPEKLALFCSILSYTQKVSMMSMK